MSKLEPHPLAEVFPLVEQAQLQELADDIKANGQDEPIVLYEGKILDGRHRYAACLIAGVEPKTVTLPAGRSPASFVLSANVKRRHLNAAQKALLASHPTIIDALRAEAKQRMAAGGRGGVKGTAETGGPSDRSNEAVAIAAKAVGSARCSAYDMLSVSRRAPEVAAAVVRGEVKTISDAVRLANEATAGKGFELPSAKAAREREEKVRELHAEGMSQRAIAKEIGITQTGVGKIAARTGLSKGNPLERLTDAVVSWGDQASMWESVFKTEWGTATPEQVAEFKRARGALASALDRFARRLVEATKERD